MNVLGICGAFADYESYSPESFPVWLFHDSAAALISQGMIKLAIEEERLNRSKHTNLFPSLSIQTIIKSTSLHGKDIDIVAYPFSEGWVNHELLLRQLERKSDDLVPVRKIIKSKLSILFDLDFPEEKIHFYSHHQCHAQVAAHHSGFAQSLIIVMDGNGEKESTSIYSYNNGTLTRLKIYTIDNSIGHYYTKAIKLLGYDLFDEYKVMGLSAYGINNAFAGFFDNTFTLLPDGDIILDNTKLVGQFIESGFPPRLTGEKFQQHHCDLAKGLQETIARVTEHILEYWIRRTGIRNICFVGGVAQNSAMLGKIALSPYIDQLFVHPASHDAGTAIGAALLASKEPVIPKESFLQPEKLTNSFLGPTLPSDKEVGVKINRWRGFVSGYRSDCIHQEVARMISNKQIVGWVQGRSEFGPRALGHRSILADPQNAETRDRINSIIKEREDYRPLAPAITIDSVDKYFELPISLKNGSQFMGFAVRVKDEMLATLQAITHVDGSARLQTVSPNDNEIFYYLLREYEKITGLPILLNTSLNNHYEPIAETVDDAIACLITMKLDYLAVDNFIIERNPSFNWSDTSISLHTFSELTSSTTSSFDGTLRTRMLIRRKDIRGHEFELSEDEFIFLTNACSARKKSYSTSMLEHNADLQSFIIKLWSKRFVTIMPDYS